MISLTTGLPLLPLLLLSICILEQQRQYVFCEGLPIPTIIPTTTKTQHVASTSTIAIINTNRIIRRRSRRDQHRQYHHQQDGGLGIRTAALTMAEMYPSNSDDDGGGGGDMFLTRKNFLRLVQSFLVVTPFLTELYSRLGSIFPNTQLPSGEDLISQPTSSSDGGESSSPPAAVVDWDKIRHITLVFHGAGGQDQYTDELMSNLKKKYQQEQQQKPNTNNSKEQRPSSSSSYCQIVEWGDYSTNLFQASYNGEAIGRIVAEYLSPKAKNIETVHLIGISVGAFAANMAATNWKQQQQQTGRGGEDGSGSTASSPSPPYVQLTLLDPFTQRGIFGIGYGQNNFGSSSSIDYTQQYLNTDDPVPSTNMPLKNAVCYDVTSVRPSEIFGHDWPLAYYAKRLHAAAAAGEKNDNFTEIVALDQRKPPGQVITVTSLD